jgi:hypothetical protein
MMRTNTLALAKAIPLLGVFSLGVLALVCAVCINESKAFLPALATYMDSGRSLFIPDIPRINLLWFLPQGQQIIPLTWGNIIDIVIFINIGLILNRIPYDCYRRASESQRLDQIFDLHLDRRDAKDITENTIAGKYSMPCIDARTALGSPAKHKAGHGEAALQYEDLVSGLVHVISCRTSRREPSRARVALLARLVSLALHVIPSSFLVEDYLRSDSDLTRNRRYDLFFKQMECIHHERL